MKDAKTFQTSCSIFNKSKKIEKVNISDDDLDKAITIDLCVSMVNF